MSDEYKGLRNPLRYGFLKNTTAKLVVKTLGTINCNAALIDNKKDKLHQVKVELKGNNFNCKFGNITHYDGGDYIALSPACLQVNTDIMKKDGMIFFIDFNERKLYGIKISTIIFGVDTASGMTIWNWILRKHNSVATLVDASGMRTSYSIAEVSKLKQVSTLQIDIPADDITAYLEEKQKSNL